MSQISIFNASALIFLSTPPPDGAWYIVKEEHQQADLYLLNTGEWSDTTSTGMSGDHAGYYESKAIAEQTLEKYTK